MDAGAEMNTQSGKGLALVGAALQLAARRSDQHVSTHKVADDIKRADMPF